MLAGGGPVLAQAYQCRVPDNLTVPSIRRPADEPRRIRPVTGYTLALSWSPEFCRTRKQSRADAIQCSGESGDFGFILHGLWPETRGPDYPQWCAINPAPVPPAVAKRNLCHTPVPRLLGHEWAKHGSCMVKRPETYYRISASLFEAVQYPDMERLSRDPLTIGMLKKAIADVNPGLDPDMMVIRSNARGWLQEVRICLGASFRPRKCPSHMRRQRGDIPVKIWRGF